MTVVVNGRFLGQRPGGLQRTARSLLLALREGYDLEVVSPTPAPEADVVLPAPPGRGGGQVWEQVLLPRHARGRLVLSLANTAPLRGRSAVLVHDLAPLVGPEWFRPSMRVYGRLVLAAARRAEVLVTVSEAVAGELRERGAAPAGVVRPAVDPLFAPAPTADVDTVRRELGLHRPYALLLGWADPRKDAHLAVAAHAEALRTVPHDLVLVGAGRGVFAEVRLPELPTVHRPGHVDDTALRALLTGAAVLLFPSRYEGFGLPPLEAAACGTPSLVADLPVLRETAPPGATYLPGGGVAAWSAALASALASPTRALVPPSRGWGDAAQELAALLP
jgi:glycosyltransferase involved in cell wall biosynthesis